MLQGNIHNEIARPAVQLVQLVELRVCAVSWATSRATWLALAGLDWLDLCPWRPCWVDLASNGSVLAAPGTLAGSIWPRMAPSGCPWRPRWLDLAALCAPGRPNWLDLAANDCPIDAISKKKSICLSTILLRCCLLRALWNVSSCLKSSPIEYSYLCSRARLRSLRPRRGSWHLSALDLGRSTY